jgi:hypothetical protein
LSFSGVYIEGAATDANHDDPTVGLAGVTASRNSSLAVVMLGSLMTMAFHSAHLLMEMEIVCIHD